MWLETAVSGSLVLASPCLGTEWSKAGLRIQVAGARLMNLSGRSRLVRMLGPKLVLMRVSFSKNKLTKLQPC